MKTGDARPWAIVASPVPANRTNTIITPPSNTVVLCKTVTDQARRVAIAAYYLKAMDAPPESNDPQTVSWIAKEWNIPSGSRNMVLQVLCDARACAQKGVEYTDKKTGSDRMTMASIQLNSVEAAIISESMEDGAGIQRVHKGVSDWLRRRHDSGEKHVSYWGLLATYACYLRLQPLVTVVQKRSQGSEDPDSIWCQACMGGVTQLMVRMEMDIPEK